MVALIEKYFQIIETIEKQYQQTTVKLENTTWLLTWAILGLVKNSFREGLQIEGELTISFPSTGNLQKYKVFPTQDAIALYLVLGLYG
ncbi:MAG: hypothetical protein EAZ76_12535 [Nostocales cyanobacterium]|nr:MAG: hypothetical protein EAZ87_16210 [Nostocales cyanobacterium]TAF13034.1 MAG: hypothetical protein EAZ76_12535 [Nostocales cyanobacterium]